MRFSPHFSACKAHLCDTYPSVREYCPAHLSGLGQPHGPEAVGLESRKKNHISPFPLPHRSGPHGPQVHVAATRLLYGCFCSAHQLPYWDRDRGLHSNAEGPSPKPGKCHCSWAPWCKELGRRTHVPLLYQYSPRTGRSCSLSSMARPGARVGNFDRKGTEKSNIWQVLNQNKAHPSKSLREIGWKTEPPPTHQCDHCHCRRQSAGLSGPCHPQHRGQSHPPRAAALTEPRRRKQVSWRGTWSERGNAVCFFGGRYMCCQLLSHLDLNQFPPVP